MKLIRITPFAVSALITVWPGMAAADVQVGGDIVVEAGKTMESAVSFGGNVTVRGTVSDAAVAIGGNVAVDRKSVV